MQGVRQPPAGVQGPLMQLSSQKAWLERAIHAHEACASVLLLLMMMMIHAALSDRSCNCLMMMMMMQVAEGLNDTAENLLASIAADEPFLAPSNGSCDCLLLLLLQVAEVLNDTAENLLASIAADEPCSTI
jgi:hypothetical protein